MKQIVINSAKPVAIDSIHWDLVRLDIESRLYNKFDTGTISKIRDIVDKDTKRTLLGIKWLRPTGDI